jgi:hypothetical protein
MTKSFLFTNPTKCYNEIFNFVTKLLYHANARRIIDDRFKCLIKEVNAELIASTDEKNKYYQQNDHNIQDTIKKIKRKSYLVQSDLHQDLVDCQCDGYLQVKSGVVMPDKFKINT